MKLFIVILSTFIVGISSQLVLPTYPSVRPMAKPLQAHKMLGKWYGFAGIPNSYQPYESCNSGEFSVNHDGSLQFTATMINRLTGLPNQMTIAAYPIQGGFSSQFNVKFPPLAIQRDSVGSILDTDYDNYAVLRLVQIAENGSILDMAWILTRNIVLSDACLIDAYAALQRNGISSSSLAKIPHDKCPRNY